MNDSQRRRIVKLLGVVADSASSEPGFMDDDELKAAYMVVHTAIAAVKFKEEKSLAEICSAFCQEQASSQAESSIESL